MRFTLSLPTAQKTDHGLLNWTEMNNAMVKLVIPTTISPRITAHNRRTKNKNKVQMNTIYQTYGMSNEVGHSHRPHQGMGTEQGIRVIVTRTEALVYRRVGHQAKWKAERRDGQ